MLKASFRQSLDRPRGHRPVGGLRWKPYLTESCIEPFDSVFEPDPPKTVSGVSWIAPAIESSTW